MKTPPMIPVMYNLRMLADTPTQSSCSCTTPARRTATKRAMVKAPGHTSITAAVDISLGTERKDLDPDVTITVGKVRRKPINPFGALFHYSPSQTGRYVQSLVQRSHPD